VRRVGSQDRRLDPGDGGLLSRLEVDKGRRRQREFVLGNRDFITAPRQRVRYEHVDAVGLPVDEHLPVARRAVAESHVRDRAGRNVAIQTQGDLFPADDVVNRLPLGTLDPRRRLIASRRTSNRAPRCSRIASMSTIHVLPIAPRGVVRLSAELAQDRWSRCVNKVFVGSAESFPIRRPSEFQGSTWPWRIERQIHRPLPCPGC
jgi:hypothetical protein